MRSPETVELGNNTVKGWRKLEKWENKWTNDRWKSSLKDESGWKQDLLAVNVIEINCYIPKKKKDKLYNSISETKMPQLLLPKNKTIAENSFKIEYWRGGQ